MAAMVVSGGLGLTAPARPHHQPSSGLVPPVGRYGLDQHSPRYGS